MAQTQTDPLLIRRKLRGYFDEVYGILGIEMANDLLKEIERMDKKDVGKNLTLLKAHLADVVMLGSEHT